MSFIIIYGKTWGCSFTARTFSETWKRQRGQNYGSIKSSWICLPLNRKQNCVDFIFQFIYRLSCTHFLYNLTLCTLIVIVMVYWFKLVALISSRAAPAQSLTVTPSVVEWVKFSRNLQQITLLRPCTLHCTAMLRADLFVSRCIISSQMCTLFEGGGFLFLYAFSHG